MNWNRRDLLRGCLESLVRQDGPDFEVVLVDNGSTDGSVQEAYEVVAGESLHFEVIVNEENAGFCRANNQGIARARGRYVALLNNDAEAEPGWLAAMVSLIETAPDVGMVASRIVTFDEPRRIDKAGHLFWPDGQNRGRGTGQLDQGQFGSVEEVLWPDGCAALYRKAMLEEVGGFDEDLFAYADDAELGLRARIAGWRCLYAPDAVVRHRRAGTLGARADRRIELIERNRVLLAVKHLPLPMLTMNIPWTLLRVAGGALAAVRGRGEAGQFEGWSEKWRLARALLRGFGQGLAGAPKAWRKRQQLRSLRRLSEDEISALLKRHRISLRELSEGAS